MSSKFSAKPAVPQPPPICRKSVKANANPAWPAWRLTTWLQITASVLTGQTLKLNGTWSMPEVLSPGRLYRLTMHQQGWQIDLALIQEVNPAFYSAALLATRSDTPFDIEAATAAFQPIKLKPFNSGYQPMDLVSGLGTAACQIRL